MFDSEFYPTPYHVIEEMVSNYNIAGKVVLEPSAGKGDIVDYLKKNGVENIIACERNDDLRKIVSSKCKVLKEDFFNVKSEDVSHIDFIIMNPPFSNAQKHIIHAWEIAPKGCRIVALCNLETVKNTRSSYSRRELLQIIESYGYYIDAGKCFEDAERETGVEVAIIHLEKPGNSYDQEFEGFFVDNDEQEEQVNGIMSYNVVRDLVNRYVAAVKLYDQQLSLAVEMNSLLSGFYSTKIGMSITDDQKLVSRADFKKDLQKSGWKWIFSKMNMEKYATKGLKEDINKFVEQQQNIPFTMKNIYHMLQIVVGTTLQRMDRALEEVFDKLTHHYHDNRYNVEGWKTNSHYLINQKFIMPWVACHNFHGQIDIRYDGNVEIIEDMVKAICYMIGENYDDFISLRDFCYYRYKLKSNGKYLRDPDYDEFVVHCKNNDFDKISRLKENLYQKGIASEIEDFKPVWGKWFTWGFFEVKFYKKGTSHFKFRNTDLWAKFNQRIAKIKGYPLFEPKPTS